MLFILGTIGVNCDFDNNTGNDMIAQCETKIMYFFILFTFGTSATMSLGGYIKDKLGLLFTIMIGSIVVGYGYHLFMCILIFSSVLEFSVLH